VMPLYKVALHRRIRDNYRCPEPNPFLAPIPEPGVTHTMLVREWTFEASNEKHALRLLQEARDLGVAAVEGFTLRNVELVKP
jgi:hypothetical protein